MDLGLIAFTSNMTYHFEHDIRNYNFNSSSVHGLLTRSRDQCVKPETIHLPPTAWWRSRTSIFKIRHHSHARNYVSLNQERQENVTSLEIECPFLLFATRWHSLQEDGSDLWLRYSQNHVSKLKNMRLFLFLFWSHQLWKSTCSQ